MTSFRFCALKLEFEEHIFTSLYIRLTSAHQNVIFASGLNDVARHAIKLVI
jgi:hypothetical protein